MSQTSSENKDTQNIRTLMHHFADGMKSLIWLVILLVCIGAVIGWFFATFTYKPVYSVSVVSTVSADVSGNTNYYNQTTAKQIAAVFPQILKSQTLKSALLTLSGNDEIGEIRADAAEDSNLFTVTVKASSPKAAYSTVILLIEHYPKVVEYVLGPTQLTLLTDPIMPSQPENMYSPIVPMVAGGAFGLIIALASILIFAYFEDTVITCDDAEKKLGCKCAGIIPYVRQKKSKYGSAPVTLFEHITQNGFSDSVRSSANNIIISAKKNGERVIFVTSTLPDEGKTTVAVNLAQAMAEKGLRPVVIDADMKSPAVLRNLGAKVNIPEGYRGIYGFLDGKTDAENVILECGRLKIGIIGNTDTEREYAKKSAELLSSARMKELMAFLTSKYDYVIIDTAPAGIVADAQAIARWADGFVYVIRQDTIHTSEIEDTINSFSGFRAKPIGTVINMARYGGFGLGYSSYRRYGYGKYGYGKYGYGKYGYGKYGYGNYGYGEAEKANKA